MEFLKYFPDTRVLHDCNGGADEAVSEEKNGQKLRRAALFGSTKQVTLWGNASLLPQKVGGIRVMPCDYYTNVGSLVLSG